MDRAEDKITKRDVPADQKEDHPSGSLPEEKPKQDRELNLDDILNGCLPSDHKLNLTADEKDELDELEDPDNDEAYQNFLKSLDQNENLRSMLNQVNDLISGGGQEKPWGGANSHPFLGENPEEMDFEAMTNKMLGDFTQKEMIYEPLQKAKEGLEELFQKAPVGEKEIQKRENDKKIYALVLQLIALYDDPDHESKDKREAIMNKFEELHELGGLPVELMKDGLKDLPKMPGMPTGENGCAIF